MTHNLLHQYEILFNKASSDLKLAKLAASAKDAGIDDATIIFHLQQSSEKLLKSILAVHDIHFEKIHDLTQLIELCRNSGIELPQYTKDFAALNPFAVIGRYDLISSDEFDMSAWINKIENFKEYTAQAIKSYIEKQHKENETGHNQSENG